MNDRELRAVRAEERGIIRAMRADFCDDCGFYECESCLPGTIHHAWNCTRSPEVRMSGLLALAAWGVVWMLLAFLIWTGRLP